jgi:hypothetical protein
MKDYRIFLRLQSALDPNQGACHEGRNTSQGYQMQHLAKHLESSIHIRKDPAGAKIQKRAEEFIKASKFNNIITTSHYGILEVVRPASQV